MSMIKRGKVLLGALALVTSMGVATETSEAYVPLLGDLDRARRARDATLELDVAAARKILDGADTSDTALALETARLLLYEGDCDGAVTVLSRPDLTNRPEAMELGDVSRGCARATAGTLTIRDDRIIVRLQDDEDRALVPLIVDVALRARDNLAKDLGVELPLPMRIDLVRDQFTLAAMTGLPEEAAQTTGTVAVAKWGRVTMISPRATVNGYAWLDTLAHELTHLALTRGTRDKAPLWLQEGVAKRQEVRWRDAEPLDDFPPVDVVARVGLDKGLGVELDKIGPSIAMLPSAEQAQVAFAEVASFVRYWAREAGEEALPQLVVRLKAAESSKDFEQAIAEVSAADFQTWVKRWRAHITGLPKDLPPDLEPGAMPANVKEIAQRIRLGELLQGRGHARAASIERARAHALVPHEPSVRCHLAESLLAMGDTQNAAPLVERIEDVHNRFGRWHSLNGLLHPDPIDLDRPFRFGIALDPLEPAVACEEKVAPELPKDPIRAAICEAARRVPR
ncbi:hypothetical protein [Polyangium spumosum]|uniref:Tetratricopeptide repeat protein n=1 Tax=Polyangium spumosum TaxID=889282 RepID=A0A6N7PPR2_9BACT|nr:hypothetical protein [Polyangium spumosum]MRG94048.1 hypothetical protein [Polyangium spumosum]